MTETWAKPCLDSDLIFNIVHEWVSKKSWRKGSLRMDWLDMVDTISREKMISGRDVSDALKSLLDAKPPIIEKTDQGFLVREKFCGTFRQSPPATRVQSKIARSAGLRRTPVSPFPAFPEAKPNGVKAESAQNYSPQPRCPQSPKVILAREDFPRLCQEAGISLPMQFTWTRLAAGIGNWLNDGLDVVFIRQMMEEFVRYPGSRQSRLSPDKLFLSRRQKLTDLVLARQNRDPNNRRYNPEPNWLGKYA
jgi:hypothetical protein